MKYTAAVVLLASTSVAADTCLSTATALLGSSSESDCRHDCKKCQGTLVSSMCSTCAVGDVVDEYGSEYTKGTISNMQNLHGSCDFSACTKVLDAPTCMSTATELEADTIDCKGDCTKCQSTLVKKFCSTCKANDVYGETYTATGQGEDVIYTEKSITTLKTLMDKCDFAVCTKVFNPAEPPAFSAASTMAGGFLAMGAAAAAAATAAAVPFAF